MNVRNIIMNVTPAIAVMVAGIVGAYMVYDNYFSDNITASQLSNFEPAAGEYDEELGQSLLLIEPAAGDKLGVSLEDELDVMTGTKTELGTVINSDHREEISLEEVSEIIDNAIK